MIDNEHQNEDIEVHRLEQAFDKINKTIDKLRVNGELSEEEAGELITVIGTIRGSVLE